MKQSLFALIKYCYIVLPLSEWRRFRLKCLIFRLLAPLVSGSAGYRFLKEQLRLSRLPQADRRQALPSGDLRPRLLLIDSCTPTPDRDSGSMDVFNSIRILIGLGYRVTFIPESNLLPLGPTLRHLGVLGSSACLIGIPFPFRNIFAGLVISSMLSCCFGRLSQFGIRQRFDAIVLRQS